MEAEQLNAAVKAMREAGAMLGKVDLADVQLSAHNYGVGISKMGIQTDAYVNLRKDVRSRIVELAQKGIEFREVQRELERLLSGG